MKITVSHLPFSLGDQDGWTPRECRHCCRKPKWIRVANRHCRHGSYWRRQFGIGPDGLCSFCRRRMNMQDKALRRILGKNSKLSDAMIRRAVKKVMEARKHGKG